LQISTYPGGSGVEQKVHQIIAEFSIFDRPLPLFYSTKCKWLLVGIITKFLELKSVTNVNVIYTVN
jgi:hypothetical protein